MQLTPISWFMLCPWAVQVDLFAEDLATPSSYYTRLRSVLLTSAPNSLQLRIFSTLAAILFSILVYCWGSYTLTQVSRNVENVLILITWSCNTLFCEVYFIPKGFVTAFKRIVSYFSNIGMVKLVSLITFCLKMELITNWQLKITQA